MRRLTFFWSDETGAVAIEYAMIATLISLSVIAGASTIGTKLRNTFLNVSNNLT